MKFSFRLQLIIGTATALCAMLIGVATYVLRTASAYTPADLLPADATIAFFSNADQSLTQSIESFLPLVHRIPLDDERADIALVRMVNGKEAWIRFAASNIPGRSANITASDQEALTLLQTDHKGLSQSEDFASLSSTYMTGNTWIYLKNPARDASFFLPVTMPTGPVSIAFSNNDARIAWVSDDDASMPIIKGLPSVDAQLVVRTGNMQKWLEHMKTSLNSTQRSAYEAILRQKVQNMFGADISAIYDLLPLLDGPGTLAMNDDAILLEGTSDASTKDILEKLHKGFRSTATSALRITQTFDEKFSIDTLQAETNAIKEEALEKNGMNIRMTTDSVSGRSFATAHHDDHFIISNSIPLFHQFTEQSANMSKTDIRAVAAGIVVQNAANDLLAPHLPGESWMNNLPSGSGGILHWELLQNRTVKMLRLY